MADEPLNFTGSFDLGEITPAPEGLEEGDALLINVWIALNIPGKNIFKVTIPNDEYLTWNVTNHLETYGPDDFCIFTDAVTGDKLEFRMGFLAAVYTTSYEEDEE